MMGRGGSPDERALFGITERAQVLPGVVQGHVDSGDRRTAAAVITRRLADVAPELPLRFQAILSKPDVDTASWILARLKDDEIVKLTLKRIDKKHLEIRTAKGRKVVGRLSSRDAATLESFGSDAKLYEPRLLEISADSDGLEHISIELVRPEIRLCTSCTKKHTGTHLNCDDCRASRKRIKPERLEPSPIELQEALDSLAEIPDGEDFLSVA